MAKIIQQLEFYFSPANLRRDPFMQQQLRQNQCLSLKTLLTFNRLKKLIAQELSTSKKEQEEQEEETKNEEEVLKKCIRDSSLLELCENDTAVKTISEPILPPVASTEGENEVKPVMTEEQDQCVLMVQQLPSDATLDEVLDFFGGLNGEQGVVLVQMRKSKLDGRFLGSAWVEFKDKDSAEAFVKRTEETEGGLIMHGSQLVVYRKAEYKKHVESNRKKHAVGALLLFQLPEDASVETRDLIKGIKQTLREKCKVTPQYIDYPLQGDNKKGLIRFPQERMAERANEVLEGKVTISLTETTSVDLTLRVPVDEEESAFWVDIKKARESASARKDQPPAEIERTYPENHFLRLEFSEVGKDVVTQSFIEKELSKSGRIRFLDYCRPPLGETEAVIRFHDPIAKTILDQLNGELAGVKMTMSVLEGDANQKLWDIIYDQQQANLQAGQKRGRNQGGRGGRRGGKRPRVGR